MSANKNDPKDAVKMTSGLDSQTQADLDALMRKYDRESNTRVWEGWQRWVVGAIMVIFSLYCIGMTLFYSGLPETRLAAFLAMIVFIGFLTYPVKKGHVKVNSMPWYDIILMLVGTSCFLYFAFNALPIIKLATRIQTHHVIIGAIGILVYQQGFGFIQLYNAPFYMALPSVAALLIGGASANKASIFNVVLGTFVFQGLTTMTPTVINSIIHADISEIVRIIVTQGMILYALTRKSGGSK